MSDTAQGEGWWQAPDGKWYPPAPTSGVATSTQTAPPPPQKTKKKFYKRWLFWIIVVVVLGLGGCIGGIAAVSNTANQLTNSKHSVEYEVTGNGTASNVTYTNVNGNGSSGTQQESDVTLPWTKHLEGKGTLSFYSLTAQSGTATSISCKITIDGKQIVSKTSTGQFAVVDCSGSPPSS